MTNISALAGDACDKAARGSTAGSTAAGSGTAWEQAARRCPKRMAHGPCAGVRADGDCEVPRFGRCSYLDVPDDRWPYPDRRLDPGPTRGPGAGIRLRTPAAAAFLATAAARPVVVVDLVAPPPPADGTRAADGIRACAAELAGLADAALIGDHPAARVQFPPSYRARLLADEGLTAWAGINCRDRNRAALEGELAACADAGVAGLHCVTGDHPANGGESGTVPVFDLDSFSLVELARRTGALCSVAHAPAAPPVHQRLPRLLAKVRAGADVVFVDHCGGAAHVAAAVGAVRAAGFCGLVFGCVPIVTSPDSAAVIASFAADRLPPGYLDTIMTAPDAVEAGIAAATRLARTFLDLPGLDGVNLSGGAGPGQELAATRAMAEVSRRLADGGPGVIR
ncbi:MAG TPA: methylenetetrahydrofolate reductase C-terminal domain-containing protein [Trebonia sp.]|nr:methylenetetrahydrofolate reductase C-terminal domain-containing protein [Trebonia sp.]